MNFTSGQIDIGGRPPPTGGSADLTPYMKTAIANTTFINETGDAMRGDLLMGGFKITNLATPTLNTDAVTKAYADSIITNSTDVATKTYVDAQDKDQVLAFLLKVGTSTENQTKNEFNVVLPSTMPSDLTATRIAPTATYLSNTTTDNDTFIVSIRSYTYTASTRNLNIVINVKREDSIAGWGSTNGKILLYLRILQASMQSITKTSSDTNAITNPFLNLAGGTMTGDINMGSQKIIALADPTVAQGATTKNYVDTKYLKRVKLHSWK